MAMQGQSSFRRILLSRILVLSIPILLLGVAVTFRKARTSLLYTARQNLTESAIRKASTIQASVQALQTHLAIASETAALQSGSLQVSQTLLNQLASQSDDIQCVQLISPDTNKRVASTCGERRITPAIANSWARQQNSTDAARFQIHTLKVAQSAESSQLNMRSQLDLALGVPVYTPTGQLRYTLIAQAALKQMESGKPWSLLGYTVIIDQDGTFLAHPLASRVGTNISSEQEDAYRLKDILTNALRNQSDARHLFNFTGDRAEWLAGFSSVRIPVTATEERTWVVLAATPLAHALQGLESITQILFILTTGLLAAHLLAMLYMARDLSRPIEQLGKYARHIHKRGPLDRAPKNFKIRELNHLSEVLDNMVRRLEERAKELETAWQEAEAANQLKSEFLANTSHELRTPLNAIIGCIRLVQDGCCDTREEEMEFLEQANKAAIHLLKIINDLLDIRRIEEEGLPLSMELVDLRDILKEVVGLQGVQVQQKGLQLTVPDLSAPIMIRADPARLKQVFLNVVYNATKFTDEGGINIRTRIETALDLSTPAIQSSYENSADFASSPESWVVVSVQDTGIGVDPAQQHKLFRPFVMVDGTTTRKFEGTGLGLAISRNLVEMMKGSISLYSDGVDQGTTVEIALPMAEQSQLSPSKSIDSPGVTDSSISVTPTVEHSAIGS